MQYSLDLNSFQLKVPAKNIYVHNEAELFTQSRPPRRTGQSHLVCKLSIYNSSLDISFLTTVDINSPLAHINSGIKIRMATITTYNQSKMSRFLPGGSLFGTMTARAPC